jgi:5-oxoprolinase (ATP-hydrolysing) subunit B
MASPSDRSSTADPDVGVRLIPYGTQALMAEYPTLSEVVAAAAAVRSADLSGVDEVVPGARTVLVQFSGGEPPGLRDVLAAEHEHVRADGQLIEVPTRYDGADLAEVAERTAMSVDALISLHSGTEFVAAFCGFAPGFAYLSGLPAELQLPRRPSPRTLVPAGSLAMASEFTGVYPTASPGGWHLLGNVTVAMFDLAREPAALIAPGDRVRFVPT